MQRFDNTVNSAMSFVDNNEYLSTALALFLVIYAGVVAPKLPESVARLFENDIFKFLVIFLVAYSARKNPTVAVIASVGLMVTLNTLNKYQMNENLANVVGQEIAEEQEIRASDKARKHANKNARFMREGMADIVLEETAKNGMENIPEEALAELQDDNSYKADYKDSFYPQYVNMKPDAYMARYTGNDINGFDPSAAYADTNNRSTYGSD